jgi:hypothetical protein
VKIGIKFLVLGAFIKIVYSRRVYWGEGEKKISRTT